MAKPPSLHARVAALRGTLDTADADAAALVNDLAGSLGAQLAGAAAPDARFALATAQARIAAARMDVAHAARLLRAAGRR